MSEKSSTSSETKFIPDSWNSPFGLFKYSKAIVQRNLATILILWIANILIGLSLRLTLGGVGSVIGYLFGAFFLGGIVYSYLEGAQGKRVELDEALNFGFGNWLNFILLGILMAIMAVGSFILFIVPFFYVLPKIVMAPYYMVDRKLNPIDAIQASWEDSTSHLMQIWQIVLLTIVFALLIFVVVGIVFYIAYSAAFTVFYLMLKNKKA